MNLPYHLISLRYLSFLMIIYCSNFANAEVFTLSHENLKDVTVLNPADQRCADNSKKERTLKIERNDSSTLFLTYTPNPNYTDKEKNVGINLARIKSNLRETETFLAKTYDCNETRCAKEYVTLYFSSVLHGISDSDNNILSFHFSKIFE